MVLEFVKIFANHLIGFVEGSEIDGNFIIFDFLLDIDHNFYDDVMQENEIAYFKQLIDINNPKNKTKILEYIPALSILNIYKALENQEEQKEFFKNIKLLIKSTDIRYLVSAWIICYIIQNIILLRINNKFKEKIPELKQKIYNNVKILLDNFKEKDFYNKYTDCEDFKSELLEVFNSNPEQFRKIEKFNKDYIYEPLNTTIWILDVIVKYESLNDTKNRLNYIKIMNSVKSETSKTIANAILGAYFGYKNMPNNIKPKFKKIDNLLNKLNLYGSFDLS